MSRIKYIFKYMVILALGLSLAGPVLTGTAVQAQEGPGLLLMAVRSQVEKSAPIVSAASYIVLDGSTGQVLAEQNSDERRAPASLTKLMTALVVREHLDMDKEVRVSLRAAEFDPSEMGLYAGEVVRVEDLLSGLLIASANDAAISLAEATSGSISGFAELMNAKAMELGLGHTYFTNPSGVDNDAHLSTAYDLAKLSMVALRDPFIAEQVKLSAKTVYSADGKFSHYLRNTNHLLAETGVFGIKTGTTDRAGQTLSFAIERQGRKLIVVMLGSVDRVQDGLNIIGWAYEHLQWQDISVEQCDRSWQDLFLYGEFVDTTCQTRQYELVF